MSEQELDAELRRYEPYRKVFGDGSVAFVWWRWQRSPAAPCDVFSAEFDKLHMRYAVGNIAKAYATREAAFLDLRQALRAAHARGG